MGITNIDVSGFFATDEREEERASTVTLEASAIAIVAAIAADPRGYKPMPAKVFTPKLAAQIRKVVAHLRDDSGAKVYDGLRLSAPTRGKNARGDSVRFLDSAGKPVHRLALVSADSEEAGEE